MISELLDGTGVRAAKEGLLKWLGRKWQRVRGGDWRERERKSDGHCERRRVVQLEDPRRHDRMREFNFLGLSIISSARGFSSFLARLSPSPFPSFFTLSQPHLGSWLALASLSLRTTYHFSSSPSFLPLSNHILKNPLRRFALAPRSSLPRISYNSWSH